MQSNNYNQHVLGVGSYGAQATINENASPICHISFYYKCCVVGCGISPRRGIVDPIIESILIDYDNADSLPGDWQRLLFESALNELKPERLLNQVIYIDDEHIMLPEDTSNSFFAIETATASSSILLQQYFLRHGLVLPLPPQSRNIHWIMLCTSGWLEEFYFNSIKQLTRQAECINSTLSGPPLPSSLLLLQGSFHCSHCRGTPGPCACECGCPNVAGSTRCRFVHRGIVCSSCKTGIEGKLYTPTNTSGKKFCERCYEDGVHDQTHSFYCFDGVPTTSVPNLIPPRVQSEEKQEDGPLLDLSLQRYIPTAEAVLIHECKTCEAAAIS